MAWYDGFDWGKLAGAVVGVAGAVYAVRSQERQQKLALAREQSIYQSLYGGVPMGGNPGAGQLDGKGAVYTTGCRLCDKVRANWFWFVGAGSVLLILLVTVGKK